MNVLAYCLRTVPHCSLNWSLTWHSDSYPLELTLCLLRSNLSKHKPDHADPELAELPLTQDRCELLCVACKAVCVLATLVCPSSPTSSPTLETRWWVSSSSRHTGLPSPSLPHLRPYASARNAFPQPYPPEAWPHPSPAIQGEPLSTHNELLPSSDTHYTLVSLTAPVTLCWAYFSQAQNPVLHDKPTERMHCASVEFCLPDP